MVFTTAAVAAMTEPAACLGKKITCHEIGRGAAMTSLNVNAEPIAVSDTFARKDNA